MSSHFAELDRRRTPLGEISLRRRLEPSLRVDVYEIKLDDEFLMSSLFTVAETDLARLALARLDAAQISVVVGGLGLGFTARTVLEDARVSALYVVEALGAVIDWHRDDLLPFARRLTTDPRCQLLQGDFFTLVAGDEGFAPNAPSRVDAILLDIDHSPRHHLDPSHAETYTCEGMHRLARRLRPGGVFAMWSNDPPDDDFLTVLGEVFTAPQAHIVSFPNFYTGGESASTVYVASTVREPTTRHGGRSWHER